MGGHSMPRASETAPSSEFGSMAEQEELFPIPAGAEPAAPLATRMRPNTFDQLVGQRQVVDVLRQLTRSGHLPSIVLWGPPGTGKTTLARLLASETSARMVAMSAVTAGAAAALAGDAAIGLDHVERALQQRHLLYDRAGDQHYDIVSALIKSVRGSDPDAAVYWMARMLEAGEDVMFVARRLVILAAEDIGLADPQALPVAVAAQQAAHFVGMPEAVLPLTEAALYLALAPKSNSALTSYGAARELIQETGNESVPLHLRNAPTGLMKSMGYGRGYKYAHDFEEGIADQVHMPEKLKGRKVYTPNPRDRKPGK